MKDYGAGDLDQRIELQRASRTRTSSGGATPSWATYATVWAQVRPMTGRERENAQRQEAAANYMVVVRYRSDLLESDRIKWGDRYLNVRFMKREGRIPFLEIEAELGKAT